MRFYLPARRAGKGGRPSGGSSLERVLEPAPVLPRPARSPGRAGQQALIGTVQAGRVTFGSPRDPQNAAVSVPGVSQKNFCDAPGVRRLRPPPASPGLPPASPASPCVVALCRQRATTHGLAASARRQTRHSPCGSALGRPLRAVHPCRAPARPTRRSPVRLCLGSPTTGGSSSPGASPAYEALPVQPRIGSPINMESLFWNVAPFWTRNLASCARHHVFQPISLASPRITLIGSMRDMHTTSFRTLLLAPRIF